MDAMPMMSPRHGVLMTTAMMVAMMLPSFAPPLWSYHRHSRSYLGTLLFAAGYAGVWSAVSMLLASIRLPHLGGAAIGIVILGAGALQLTHWKARRLHDCRRECVASPRIFAGCRLGISCVASCAGPTAVLLAAGMMDIRVMLAMTAVIAVERIGPAGLRAARLTGALGVSAGVVILLVHSGS